MDRDGMIELVERYFTGVDNEDFQAVTGTLSEDCVFSVETHNIRFEGLAEIEAMLDRLWSAHKAVSHRDFVHVPDPDNDRIASRFAVVNTHHDGSVAHKSNCNFFEIRDGRFYRVAVYMAGENTLTSV